MTERRKRIHLDGVSVAYNDSLILKTVSLDVWEGEVVALIGKSGCGKTTLLKAAAGLLSPREGAIDIDAGEGLLSLMFQKPLLFPWLNASENVQLPGRLADRSVRTEQLFASVRLTGNEKKYPWELSEGMQRRVSLARALAMNQEILLLDEPFSGVDEITSESLHELLAKIIESTRITCLFTTHNLYEAVFLADAVVVLSGSPATVSGIHRVAFPRPRSGLIRESAAFAEEVGSVRALLSGGKSKRK